MQLWQLLRARTLLPIAFVAAMPALAQPATRSMEFTTHDPCGGGNAEYCLTAIVGRGVFDDTTVAKFRAVLEEHRRIYRIAPPGTGISAVILDSPGGSLPAGIALGLELRRLKIGTRAVSSFSEYVRINEQYRERPLLRKV